MFRLFNKQQVQLPTLAIDLDGVLHNYDTVVSAGKMGEPIRGSREAMQALSGKGYVLVIYSPKINGTYGKRMVTEWLELHEIPYAELSVHRPPAAIYIDDRGLQFKTWR